MSVSMAGNIHPLLKELGHRDGKYANIGDYLSVVDRPVGLSVFIRIILCIF